MDISEAPVPKFSQVYPQDGGTKCIQDISNPLPVYRIRQMRTKKYDIISHKFTLYLLRKGTVCTLSPLRPFKTSRHFERGSPKTTKARPNAKLCLLNNIYFGCVPLAHGSPTFLWQGGETVIVGWLEGRTWKNKNKWYT
jgi:hypothetical protein